MAKKCAIFRVAAKIVRELVGIIMFLHLDFPIGGFSPPEGRLARGFKPPAFSRFLFQSAVKSAESF
jgi:hypothetical protein